MIYFILGIITGIILTLSTYVFSIRFKIESKIVKLETLVESKEKAEFLPKEEIKIEDKIKEILPDVIFE
jgi:predicted Holliday junction resolvase-like endonuclease